METIYKLYEASKCQEAKLAAFKILHRYSKSQSYFFSKILIISHSLKLRPQKKRKRRKNKSSLRRMFLGLCNPPLSGSLISFPLRGSGATATHIPGPLQIKTQLTHTGVPDLQVHTPCVSIRPFSWVQADNPVKRGWPPASSSIVSKIRIWSQVSEDQAQWHELAPLIDYRGQETKCSMMLLARRVLFQPHSSPFASA